VKALRDLNLLLKMKRAFAWIEIIFMRSGVQIKREERKVKAAVDLAAERHQQKQVHTSIDMCFFSSSL